MEWELSESDFFRVRLKKYKKNKKCEIAQALKNVDKYIQELREIDRPMQVSGGYIHKEPHGAVAVDQKGSGNHLSPIRVYLYPDEETKTVWIVTVGTKRRQQKDIKELKSFIQKIKQGKNE